MESALMYLRVSGEAQITGDGFPRQREKCLRYASDNDIEIVAEFRDEGITGKMELENREGLSACIAAAQAQNIKIVIVEDSTRLARDIIVAEVCIREFQRIGVTVISASGGVNLTEGDDSNPTAKLIRQILAAVSEWDRCVINLKLKGARERKRSTGQRCEGRIPFGEKPGEADTLQEMLDARRHGFTYDGIAELLNQAKAPTRRGKPWDGATVWKIVARHQTKEVA